MFDYRDKTRVHMFHLLSKAQTDIDVNKILKFCCKIKPKAYVCLIVIVSILSWKQKGDTPLHLATKDLKIKMVQLLAKQGADCNRENEVGGGTFVHKSKEI